KKNGVNEGQPVTLNSSGEWTYEWNNLTKYENGNEVVYSVVELKADGTTEINDGSFYNDYYRTTYSDDTFTITNTLQTVLVSGVKTWVDNNNQDGLRPNNVTVSLLADGSIKETKTITANNNWSYAFINLPKYKDGQEIVYSVREQNVPSGYTDTYDGYNIVNTYIPNTTEITVTKEWDDGNNQDGIRPVSINVRLYANNKVYIEKETIYARRGWTHTFTNLPSKEKGATIQYRVVELDENGNEIANNGKYNNSYTKVEYSADSFTIKNIHIPKTVSKKVVKTWNDNNNQDGLRPESINVQLYANGETAGNIITLNEANSWTHTFENLAVYENGVKITYKVEEVEVPNGYEVTYSALSYKNTDEIVITNTHNPEKISIEGTKTWENDNENIRPDEITVQLYANGIAVEGKEIKVTPDDDGHWKYRFENIDKFSSGEEISYTVKEKISNRYLNNGDEENGYKVRYEGYNIINAYLPGETSVTVTKIWEDNNNQDGLRPETVQVQLKKNGVNEGQAVILSANNNWIYTWETLPEKENGETIQYTVEEVNVPNGYTVSYSEDTFTITNTYIPGTISKTVTKVWEDNNDQDGLRPTSVKVQLKKNGTNYEDEVILNKDNNWSYTWATLPEKENGETIQYTVEEVNVPNGYTVSYSEDTFTITNIHNPETINKKVTKVWDDSDNKDGLRPAEITVQLYANGKSVEGKVEKITANENGTWTCEFAALPKYANGKVIKYTVREVNGISGYSISYANEVNNEFVITNKHVPGTISIRGIKTWEDNNNQDGIRPNDITINLLANGEKIKNLKVTPDENGDWKYEFANLDKFAAGKEIVYTITEEAIEGYTQEITGYDIKNIHIPETVEKTVTKVWEDEENKDNLRPTSIEVQLKNGDKNVGEIVTLDAGEDGIWQEEELKFTWSNLPKYEDGQQIAYTVVEVNVPEKYVATYSDDTFTITNKYIPPEKTSIKVVKVWEDNENSTGKRPEKITINLLANGEIINRQDVTQSDNWYCIFDNLEEHDENNEKIIYTVTENAVPGYTTIISEFDEDEREYTITNTCIPESKIDLSLRKFITAVNGQNVEINRNPIVNVSGLKNGRSTTAIYNHRKEPVAVTKGDIVTYTIRVYNEGEVNAYVSKITDHLPSNLIPIIEGVTGINPEKYANEIEFNENYLWTIEDSKTIYTEITKKDGSYTTLVDITKQSTMLSAFYKEDGTTLETLDYIDVQIKCLVSDNAESGETLTNIAEITGITDEIGNTVSTDIDSTVDNVRNIYYIDENLPTYIGETGNKSDLSDSNYYYKGQEDDDDFEKLVIKVFDLALQKYIYSVNDLVYNRVPRPNIINRVITYTKPTDVVEVETNDIVTYTIRIYNEGDISGYAKKVIDDIPEGLEFLPENTLNKQYKWIMLDKEGEVTRDVEKAVKISTNYLSKEEEEQEGDNLIQYFNGTIFSYKDVQVSFKVVQKATSERIIINTAEIAEDVNEKNEPVKDIDSVPDNNVSTEDDIDTEKIKLVYFDLALRKFITAVNDMSVNNRLPEVTMSEEGKVVYTHTKTPLEVETNDIVIYTIRVYNEGKLSGYAEEITDDIPQGLEFLPENLVNTQYTWKMIDEAGEETTDVTKATKITTDYLSKENDSEERQNVINKFETVNNISYKDVKVAFKVVEPSTSERIIINIAQISNDKDYRGNEAYDCDSIPGNDKENEDDIDKEYVRVKFFDLKLAKWVSKYSVTYNGKTQTKETGYSEEKEEIVKIDLEGNKLTKTSIEYKYIIKVTNEGEISGYAEEIKDYIPDGLSFSDSKNPDWKMLEDGSVVTTKLSNTLLKPGESAIVEITLDWVRDKNNTGVLTNLAEISIDRNDANTPDVDSTPNNKVLEEDDIDDAKVAISVKTGEMRIYFLLTTVVIAIIGAGTYGIKKYVI
ncbi:MAG: Cna B-type domain-containing protein, partial [Clostridia bacterium]|nr:Cna B-type domain-containing protein [Clostridia bacterium]